MTKKSTLENEGEFIYKDHHGYGIRYSETGDIIYENEK